MKVLTVVCIYERHISSDCSALFESLDGVPEGENYGDSVVLFDDFRTYVGGVIREGPLEGIAFMI